MRSVVAFAKELFAKRFLVGLTIVVAVYALIMVFAPGWKNTWGKVLVGLLVVALLLSCRTLLVGYQLYLSGIRPLSIIEVHEGTSLHLNRAILTLEGREWLKESHWLLLTVRTKYGDEEVGILEVVSFTSAHYAQAKLVVGVRSISECESFVKDSSRWRSLKATPLIKPLVYSAYEGEEYERSEA